MSLTGIGEISDLVTTVVNKIWPDKTQAEKDQLALAVQQAQNELALTTAQTDINKVEAASSSLFVAGWRPMVGWSGALGLFHNYVLQPIVSDIAKLCGSNVVLAPMDMSLLSPILMAILGLGAYRTYEKVNGIKSGH